MQKKEEQGYRQPQEILAVRNVSQLREVPQVQEALTENEALKQPRKDTTRFA